jgi:hypothetical protein
MLLQLQDYGTSLWQLSDQAISLPIRLKGRGLLSVQSEAPDYLLFATREAGIGPSRKPPWPAAGSAVWGRPAARALALIRRS